MDVEKAQSFECSSPEIDLSFGSASSVLLGDPLFSIGSASWRSLPLDNLSAFLGESAIPLVPLCSIGSLIPLGDLSLSEASLSWSRGLLLLDHHFSSDRDFSSEV
ncbi:hypothetical protein QJS04_geneDACA021571 [Acorus gramineus]|uniref:Uncharacterized protein n=1 Tax=Acorus gramineus TaxID=55184 RepID=A0AAV9B0K3_ACOGR|nr:hypothetical protein QJS04_geneDACA021571 [Acorus gramineus]